MLTHQRSSVLVGQILPLAFLAGCIGWRTPLDERATVIVHGPDIADVTPARDAVDSPEAPPPPDSADAAEVACGGTTLIDTRTVQADILILLDRSDSMNWSLTLDSVCAPSDATCTTRADAMVPALKSVMADNPGVNWGLELFPYPDQPLCRVASYPQVEISADAAWAIEARLDSFTTGPSTPTGAAIVAATAYLETLDDARSKAILLATDGLPTCGSTDYMSIEAMLAEAVTAAGRARESGFPVYVIGIGIQKDNLDNLAKAGGTGSYYPATSTSELNQALESIARVVTKSCTFKGSVAPPDKDLVQVYADGRLIARDDGDGWTYDPADPSGSTITLTGASCQAMLDETVAQVRIVAGCPGG
jgi:hypothetical protein